MVKDMSKQERIKQLEEELSTTKYNKATQGHIGLVKAKIAKLKMEIDTRARSQKKGEGYAIKRTGDATIALLGFPSVGKSTLLNALTAAQSKTAAYAFTTLTAIPGMMEVHGAKIQVVDIPGLVEGAAAGTGRGREVLGVIRGANLVLMLVDINSIGQVDALSREVYDAGIRLNALPPRVIIKPQPRGGIKVGATVKQTQLSQKEIEEILKEFRITNADVVLRENVSIDRFIDAVEGNRAYLPSVLAINKMDSVSESALAAVRKRYPQAVFISAKKHAGLEELREAVFARLRLLRIYLKEPDKKADTQRPLILQEGASVHDVCSKIHKDFVRKFRFCRVWGASAKFPGQKFTAEHVVADGDVVEIVLN